MARPGSYPESKVFGDRVRRRRLRRDWTIERLAEAAGMHWTYVGSVERGERNISLHNIVRLAEALEVDVGTLVRGLDSKTGQVPTRRRGSK